MIPVSFTISRWNLTRRNVLNGTAHHLRKKNSYIFFYKIIANYKFEISNLHSDFLKSLQKANWAMSTIVAMDFPIIVKSCENMGKNKFVFLRIDHLTNCIFESDSYINDDLNN